MTILIQTGPSYGAVELTAALNDRGVRALRRSPDSNRTLRRSSFLVNWGCSGGFEPQLNSPRAVATAVNKARTFNALFSEGVSVPMFVSDNTPPLCVAGGVNTTGQVWLARHSLTGSGGEGITVVRPDDVWPDVPLYVRYVPKLLEFRVHAFRILNETNTLVRQKLRQSDAEQTRDQRLIRNYNNGWVFGLVRDEGAANLAKTEAIKALAALGLDFGAVDVIIGRDDGKAYVLEVNTRPGLEYVGSASTEFYAEGIISRYNLWRNRNGH